MNYINKTLSFDWVKVQVKYEYELKSFHLLTLPVVTVGCYIFEVRIITHHASVHSPLFPGSRNYYSTAFSGL